MRVPHSTESSNWNPRAEFAGEAIVKFTILRDGSIRNVRIDKSSGNYALDASAQRAVTEANPLPHLPDGFERNVANVEFWFQLKR